MEPSEPNQRVLPTTIYQEAIPSGSLQGTVIRVVYSTRWHAGRNEEFPLVIVEVKKTDAVGADSWQEIEGGELYSYAAARIGKPYYDKINS